MGSVLNSPLTSKKVSALKGSVTVPGDKSISHRALILGSQAVGKVRVTGLLESEDVLNTLSSLQGLGIEITKEDDGWTISGLGVGGLSPSGEVLDMGNSGTGVRLMMGLVSSYPFSTKFTGDESLVKRPMGRVIKPLEEMGVTITANDGNLLPLEVTGYNEIFPISYKLPVASAQVKSCILLAALNVPGKTSVIEESPTRDHTEIMMKYLGVDLTVEDKDGVKEITITGQPEIEARDINVPADPSSAAFLAVAALIVPDSNIVIKNVLINPLRIGLYESLKEMGANIEFTNERNEAGEKIADIAVSYSQLKGITIPADRAPSMIDEYPILAVAAANADGKTVMEGLKELRVKESDRLAAIAEGLEASGVSVKIDGDTLIVEGGEVPGGGKIKTYMDHRIAMSFLILGMVSNEAITVDDGNMINTSFPGFVDLMNSLGAEID